MPSRKTAAAPPAPEGPRDFVAIAKAYARRAADEKNRKHFGIWIRLAARRFLKDLDRAAAKAPPFVFDEWHACDVCDFAEKLPHIEGTWATPTIVLHESHVFFLVQLFGFRKLDGSRRFSSALFAIARKNAKSTLAAIVGLYCQNCEGENGPQVITGATTGQQARIVFNVAKRMVEKTEDLRVAFGLEPFANAIASYNNGGSYKPINAKASTQDGLNPSCVKQTFNLQGVAFDGWNASQPVQRLNAAGVNMVQFIQGPKSYHPAMQDLEIAYLNGALRHGNDPVLNWNASNLVARQDVNLNMAPDKKRSTEKIDDMCALLMANGISLDTKPVFSLDDALADPIIF